MIRNWIKFLRSENAILVRNEEEHKQFVSFLRQLHITDGNLDKNPDFTYWQHIARINDRDKKFKGYILWEYSNYSYTFSTSIEDSIAWYGVEPIKVSELQFLED